jgi:uracil-DNA glycosylase
VQEHKANSHKNLGWLNFTLEVIKALSERGGVVFVLWGANAISYKKYIDINKNYIISSPHPSPLSAYQGFFGSKPFSKVNAYLEQMHKQPIEW